jgi:methanogenic corrinoid protein MtbC1
VFDRLLATATVDTILVGTVLPYLRELGARWERGEASIAQEHFASGVLRGRLLGLARGWGLGRGPVALLACLPGEQHDLGLISFGLVLRARGWRIVYLGADAPISTIDDACRLIDPPLVVLSSTSDARTPSALPQLLELAGRYRVALGGAAAHINDSDMPGLLLLSGDPVTEAERVTALIGVTPSISDGGS